MKAPDKIKIGKHNITSDGDVVFGWVINEPDCEAMQHDIEYTRTDAFIEKVYTWLKNYAFVDDNKSFNLPILLHDFLKDSRKF